MSYLILKGKSYDDEPPKDWEMVANFGIFKDAYDHRNILLNEKGAWLKPNNVKIVKEVEWEVVEK